MAGEPTAGTNKRNSFWQKNEGRLTGEQSMRWSILFATIFIVSLVNMDRYRFSVERFNGIYLVLIFLLPFAILITLINGPRRTARNTGLILSSLVLPLCILALCHTAVESKTLWPAGDAFEKVVPFYGGHAAILPSNDSSCNARKIKVFYERQVLLGVLKERKVLIEISPARFETLWHVNGAMHLEVYPQGGGASIIRDYDPAWDGTRNPTKTEVIVFRYCPTGRAR